MERECTKFIQLQLSPHAVRVSCPFAFFFVTQTYILSFGPRFQYKVLVRGSENRILFTYVLCVLLLTFAYIPGPLFSKVKYSRGVEVASAALGHFFPVHHCHAKRAS